MTSFYSQIHDQACSLLLVQHHAWYRSILYVERWSGCRQTSNKSKVLHFYSPVEQQQTCPSNCSAGPRLDASSNTMVVYLTWWPTSSLSIVVFFPLRSSWNSTRLTRPAYDSKYCLICSWLTMSWMFPTQICRLNSSAAVALTVVINRGLLNRVSAVYNGE